MGLLIEREMGIEVRAGHRIQVILQVIELHWLIASIKSMYVTSFP